MSIQFKTGKPEASEFHVEAGDYKLKVIEATEDTSKNGNDMIKLKLRIINDDNTEGPALFDYLVFSEKGFWKVDTFLKSAGKHPGEGENLDIYADELIGFEVEATLSVEEYGGKKSNKVLAYLWDAEF